MDCQKTQKQLSLAEPQCSKLDLLTATSTLNMTGQTLYHYYNKRLNIMDAVVHWIPFGLYSSHPVLKSKKLGPKPRARGLLMTAPSVTSLPLACMKFQIFHFKLCPHVHSVHIPFIEATSQKMRQELHAKTTVVLQSCVLLFARRVQSS